MAPVAQRGQWALHLGGYLFPIQDLRHGFSILELCHPMADGVRRLMERDPSGEELAAKMAAELDVAVEITASGKVIGTAAEEGCRG
jgi:hypothetical protein